MNIEFELVVRHLRLEMVPEEQCGMHVGENQGWMSKYKHKQHREAFYENWKNSDKFQSDITTGSCS